MGFRSARLKSAIKWVKKIDERIVPSVVEKIFRNSKTHEEYKADARNVLLAEVYSYPKGDYERTMNLLNSVKITATNDPIGFTIDLDEDISPAKTTPEYSYGRYFLPEFSAFSFLATTKPGTETRPFQGIWMIKVGDNIIRKFEIELDKGLKR